MRHELNSHTRLRGFTLVELLVVIAIIGVLVALLLPAVQAAREAGRRTTCSNQMRQMSLALQNHESARKTFPSGGIDPWPNIEDYASGGRAFSAPKQGLSWAFQILPYLEQNAIHDLVSKEQLPLTPVNLYFCPSRRPPTAHPTLGRWLMDYAALVAAPSRSQVGAEASWAFPRGASTVQEYDQNISDGSLCKIKALWGGSLVHIGSPPDSFNPASNRPSIFPTQGVIVRSSYYVLDGTGEAGSPQVFDLGLPKPTGFRQITDGSSNTVVLTEKRIAADRLDGPFVDDDAGWSDGWDFDTLRLATCPPTGDSQETSHHEGMTAGSSHISIFFCAFADASVRGINYDIDLQTFNLLAHKSDGEIVDLDF